MNVPAFDWHAPGRIRFGPGTASELPAIAASLGTRAWWVTGSQPSRWSGLRDALAATCEVVGESIVGNEPTVDASCAGAEACRSARANVVVAVGGGSVIDAAKAIAGLSTNPGDPFDHLEVIGRGRPLVHAPLPCVALPTTAGAGSEATRNAVLASPAHRLKVSLRHPGLLPRVALVDPELTHGLPPSVTAFSGIDALTQLLEPWVSRRAQPMTDALCEAALRRIGPALLQVMTSPTSEARATMSWCALMGGLALANAGLGVIHGFAAPLGGLVPIPHGALCAAMAAPGVAANLRALEQRRPASPTLARYDLAATWLVGRPDATRHDLVPWLAALARRAGVPALKDAGLAPDQVADVVAAAQRSSSMSANPIPLDEHELSAALRDAMDHG